MSHIREVSDYVMVSEFAAAIRCTPQYVYKRHRKFLVNMNPPGERPAWRVPRWYYDLKRAQAAPPKEVSA